MVEVYLWVGVPGHIALKVDGGTPTGTMYLSRFPGSLTNALIITPEGSSHKYEEDVAAHGQPHIVRLSKLNETAVKDAVAKANKAMVYNDFGANCSSHVKFCLDCGVTGSIVGGALGWLGMGWAVSNTPYGVFVYAQSLSAMSG